MLQWQSCLTNSILATTLLLSHKSGRTHRQMEHTYTYDHNYGPKNLFCRCWNTVVPPSCQFAILPKSPTNTRITKYNKCFRPYNFWLSANGCIVAKNYLHLANRHFLRQQITNIVLDLSWKYCLSSKTLSATNDSW